MEAKQTERQKAAQKKADELTGFINFLEYTEAATLQVFLKKAIGEQKIKNFVSEMKEERATLIQIINEN